MIVEQTGQNGPAELSVREFTNQHFSFDTFLDGVCERLQDTRQQGSLKLIRKLMEKLDALDRELDELMAVQADMVCNTNLDCNTNPVCETNPVCRANPDRE